MGEHIGQRNTLTIATKGTMFKMNTLDAYFVHTKLTSDAQIKKSSKAKTSIKLKSIED